MPGLDEYEKISFSPEGKPTVDLSHCAVSWSDNLGARCASVEYIKRDGAEVQTLGASQAIFRVDIALMGRARLVSGGAELTAKERYRELVKIQRENPKGKYNHPRLGSWNVVLCGIQAKEDPETAVDVIEASLEFIEDQIDQALAIEAQATPQALANRATNAYTIAIAATTLAFGKSSNPALIAARNQAVAFSLSVITFTQQALDSAQLSDIVPGLWLTLGIIEQARTTFFVALDTTLSVTLANPVSLVEIKDLAYAAQAACHELLIATETLRPTLIVFSVPVPMSMIAACEYLYGHQAQEHLDEVRRLNPHAPTVRLPQDYKLRVVAPVIHS